MSFRKIRIFVCLLNLLTPLGFNLNLNLEINLYMIGTIVPPTNSSRGHNYHNLTQNELYVYNMTIFIVPMAGYPHIDYLSQGAVEYWAELFWTLLDIVQNVILAQLQNIK